MAINFNFHLSSFSTDSKSQVNDPSMTAFNNSLKNKTSEDIAKMMGDPNLSQEKRLAAMGELLNRLLKKGEDPKNVKDAADKAINKDGKVDPDGMAKLLEMLGIPHGMANALAEMIADAANGGGDNNHTNTNNNDEPDININFDV